jgi:RNA polymerase sigma-70 factor (ECF subfamily)
MPRVSEVIDPVEVMASQSFEEFFETHRRELFAAMLLVTHDRHEAEDIAQETFVRMWQRWDRLEAIDDPVAYAFRIAMNVWRSRRRRVQTALRRALHSELGRDDLSLVDEADAVTRAMRHLSPRERAVVILTDLLDWTSQQAGSALGIRASTVRVLRSRAHEKLRERMGVER